MTPTRSSVPLVALALALGIPAAPAAALAPCPTSPVEDAAGCAVSTAQGAAEDVRDALVCAGSCIPDLRTLVEHALRTVDGAVDETIATAQNAVGIILDSLDPCTCPPPPPVGETVIELVAATCATVESQTGLACAV